MAILSDYQEDEEETKLKPNSNPSSSSSSKTLSFNATFDPRNPIGIVERMFDFLVKETDFMVEDTAEKEIMAVVKSAKDKIRKKIAGEREREASLRGNENKRLKEEKKPEVKEENKVEVKKEMKTEVNKEIKPEVKDEPMEVEKEEESGARGINLFRLLFISFLCLLITVKGISCGEYRKA